MRVATANVLKTLDDHKAAKALDEVLAHQPQIVGLQEWQKDRARLLASRATVYRLPRLRKRLGRKSAASGYVFGYPLGGGPPVGVDVAWGELLALRTIRLASGKGVRDTNATEAIIRERATGRLHVVLNLHLLAHHDRAAYLAGWKVGRAKAIEWVDSWTGFDRWVMGDTNKNLMNLPPLVSCWKGNAVEHTGPHGGTIDNIYADRRASSAQAISTPSDHDAVVAEYPEES